MSRASALLKNLLITVHRWMGVFFCVLFSTWFASGMAMMYWDYPEVLAQDRLRRESALDTLQIKVSPQDAYAKLDMSEPPDATRLVTFDGRPAYRFRAGNEESIVYADSGQRQNGCPPELSLRIASAWSGQPPAAAAVAINTEEDQWTVAEEFRDLGPLRKYSWPSGEQVYVSTVTCDVAQFTTRASRLGAYLGPIPHWLYFTPLRRRGNTWSGVVIWASGLATVVAILGLAVGALMYSPSKRYQPQEAPSAIPYVGQKRWHMILGLTFGTLACTWAFSGMLSMDPFPALQSGDSEVGGMDLAEALQGTPATLTAFSAKLPQEALAEIRSNFRAAELELTSVMGEPVYVARDAQNQTLIVPVAGEPKAEFDRQSILDTLRRAARPYEVTQVRVVNQYEAYYLDRHNALPLPVIFVQFNDTERSMYYVDPKTASIVEGYNSHSRWNRWLYHGLHSMNVPWLYKYRTAWDILVLALLAGGFSLCVTSLVLAWRAVCRKLARTP